MFRLVALTLLLVNLLYWVWVSGLFGVIGLAKRSHSEPERLTQQIAPQLVFVNSVSAINPTNTINTAPAQTLNPQGLPAIAPAVVASSSPTPIPTAANTPSKSCWLSGLYAPKDLAALGAQLKTGADLSWSAEDAQTGGVWLVYMGRYADKQRLQKKLAEVRDLGVAIVDLPNAALNPGFALGVYKTREQAQSALKILNTKSIRTARVLQSDVTNGTQWLKIEGLDATIKAQWTRLGATKPLMAC